MAKIGAAILVLAGLLGARGAAREIAAPFEGLDRLAQARISPATEAADATRFDDEIPPARAAEEMTSLPEQPRENTEHAPGIEVIYLRDKQGITEVFTLGAADEWADSTANASTKLAWAEWKERAILALPEDLRHDSDQRRAIDWLYLSAAPESLDELSVDLISRPPIGGYDIGGVGFTDIDERADSLPGYVTPESARSLVYDLRAQPEIPDAWTVFLEDWKARAMAALPEAERNDPNRLKEIDTTLEMLKRSVGPVHQERHWGQIQFEVMIYQEKAQVATK